MKLLSAHHRLAAVGMSLLAATLACSAPVAGQETPTQPEEAVQVITNTPAAATQVVTVPSDAPAATSTSAPPPAPGVTPSATSCLYNSVFVTDMTIPDGTEVQVGNTFTKTWRIKNNGCQTWPSGTTLIFVSGNQMSGPANVSVPETAVGGSQDVSVNLKAPGPAGDFQGYWQLRTPGGIQFGDKVFIKIKATSPSATAAPTNTPGPTASPSAEVAANFTVVEFTGIWHCTATGGTTVYRYTAKITNTGTLPLQSMHWSVQSPVGTELGSTDWDAPFQTTPTDTNCNAAALWTDSLAVGASAWVSGQLFSPIASGQASRLVLKICTENGGGGSCKSRNVNFTP